MRNIVRTNIITQTTGKTIRAFVSFVTVLLALTCPSFQGRATAQDEGFAPQANVVKVPRDYVTIQAAVNAATEGDAIMVAAGVYQENVVVTTSDLRLQATNGVVLDGTALGGIGIFVRGTSATAPIAGVEVSGFEIRNFTDGLVAHHRG